ncbi:MAG: beta-glucosidase, partial [Flavisolibacter sp.]|nr:beta-glucosidase [Flavisolibacter sp.]
MHSSLFGNDFKWGASASAFQTEGAFETDGKGLSIWDVFCKKNGKIFNNHNANESCDFYNRYQHDIILLDFLGLKNFRFSLSWSRLFAEGIGSVNEKGFDFYNRLIDFCLEMQIDPWVTLYHWDLPQKLEEKGGWTNRDILFWFEEFTHICIAKFGDRVKNWIILNEPMVFTGAGYFLGIHAPGKKGLNNFLAAAHHTAMCQALGARVAKSLRNDLNIGTTFSYSYIEPVNQQPENMEAAERVDVLTNRMFLEPLLGMGYPGSELSILKQIEKYMLPNDEKDLQCNMDFIGVQNYTREIVAHSSYMPYVNAKIIKAEKRDVQTTSMNWEVYPQGIYHALKRIASYTQVKNIIVTENGASFDDTLINGKVADPKRISFLNDYLKMILRAKKEGVPVSGYFIWSLTDNFEWAEGYNSTDTTSG